MNSPYEGKFYVSQGFYPSRHNGLDLVGVDSKNIHATQKGIVHYADWENPANHAQGFGQYVCIKGIDGLFYYFGHLSQIKVAVGQSVNITDVIGVEGSTGYSTGSHCHYEVRKAFYKGAEVVNINTLSGIPNKEWATLDDGYRPLTEKPITQTINFRIGDLVKIKNGAKYYNGVSIPAWVMNDKWYVSSVVNDRIVLGFNLSKTRNIQSPVKNTDLESTSEDNQIQSLQIALNEKGYKCAENGVIDDEMKSAMFKALCDIFLE